jgi:hypothetical protein
MKILHTFRPVKMVQSVPKRRHIKFRRRGITQKKAYNIQNTAKVGNQIQIVGIASQLTAIRMPNVRLPSPLYVLFAVLLITLLYIFLP